MKLTAILCVVLQVILSVLGYAADYWLGYSESTIALRATDPILLLLLYVILFLILLSTFFYSLAVKKGRLWTTCAVIAYLAYSFIPFSALPSHGSQIVYGLRSRMLHDYGIDRMRLYARDIDQVLQGGSFDHGEPMTLSADQLVAYNKLKPKYPFLSWKGDGSHGPSIMIFGNAVNTDWGGPFGHWGFSIASDRGQNDAPKDPEYFVVRVSDDIYFYMD